MRKIYPPPFAIFIFYGLLSLAVITSAQPAQSDDVCKSERGGLKDQSDKRMVVGYFYPGTGTDVSTIKWEFYDYLNYVVDGLNIKDKIPFPDSPTELQDLTAAGKSHNTKILLSIKGYDVTDWGNCNGEGCDFYTNFLGNVLDVITDHGFDGLDIEYPGTRGYFCIDPNNQQLSWNAEEATKFKNFIKGIRGGKGKKGLGGDKTLMLTVGNSNLITELFPELAPSLNGHNGFLNFETYHMSLYSNYKKDTNVRVTSPNAPFSEFSKAYNDLKSSTLDQGKIIMGVDFGNTIQIVTNSKIIDSPSITFVEDGNTYDVKGKFPDISDQLVQFKSLCTGDNLPPLYSFPWKVLSNLLNKPFYCTASDGWERRFDNLNDAASRTPWLYRKLEVGACTECYHFISYEDISSLSNKLAIIGKKDGISISDIRYDGDDNTLLNLVRYSKFPDGANPAAAPSSGNNGKTPDTSNNKTEVSPSGPPDKSNVSSIVGGVLGGLMGSVLLVTAGFMWYRRKNPKTKEIPRGSFASHTALKNEGEQNQIVQNTVIPVAPGYVTAMFDFTGKEENDLSFRKGDKIEVLEKGDGPNDWWVGRVNGVVGEFPGNYVKET